MKDWEFEINPYYWFIKRIINSKYRTIVWHIDDIKISHVDPEVLPAKTTKIEEVSGKEDPLNTIHGKVNKYLDTTLDYYIPGKVHIHMIDYIKNIIDGITKYMNGEATNPAPNQLFVTNKKPRLINKDTTQLFKHNIAKILFLCNIS